MPRSEFADLNGLRHHLLTFDAPATAPTLVLLHGFLDLAWSFAPFCEELQRAMPIRIVAVDLRGHGETARVGAGGYYHFADYVADVHALLATMPDRPHLLGHSMGGTIASLVAGTFPDAIAKLVLVEGLGPPPLAGDEPPDRMAQWIREVTERRAKPPRPMKSLADAAAKLRDANPRLEAKLAEFLAEKATRPLDGGFVWAFDPLHRTRSPAPYSVEQYRHFLRRITAPTLLVEGADSGFASWIDDDRVTDLPSLQRISIAGAGHMLHHDRPAELARVIAAFLASP